MPHARVRIGLLSGARVAVGEAVVDRLPTRRLAALLAYLALRPDWELRERVAEAIWPDLPEGKGLASLRNGLSVLRRILGEGAPAIETTRTHARLARPACACDVWSFWDAVGRGEPAEAIRLYAGDLLPDVYDAWLEPYRDGLRDAFHATLATEAGRRLAAGEPERALALAERWREGDPYAPEAARLAARSLAASGRPAAARDALEAFDREARAELGSSPLDLDAARREAEAEAVVGRPALPEPPSYAAPGAVPDPRLPPYLSRFFGRERELADLRAWAGSPSALLTVLGAGGIGKTRLAVEAARALVAEGFEVVFIPLAGVDSRGAMVAAVLRAFELREPETGTPEGALRAHLAGLPGLTVVVLDNLEQIAEAAAVVLELAPASPRLRLLATSRERLGIEGEEVLRLAPLPAEGEDAARMFGDRARAARSDFALTERNREEVGALCRELDGLPLAIEIVAAWAGAWTVAQMRANVRERKVSSRRRGGDPRHRSLEASLAWSLNLLEGETRAFLHSLSLFRGGWTLEAAEALTLRPDAGETLAALVDRSLVSSVEIDGGIRFSMLETVRAHLLAELDEADVRSAAPRFVRFFVVLTKAQTNACAGAQERLNHRSLDRERENFEVAVGFCEAGFAPVEDAAALVGQLHLHWTYRGLARTGVALIERVLAVGIPERSGPGVLVALYALGVLAQECDDLPKVDETLARLQALAERHEDPTVRFRVATQAGNYLNQRGRFDEGLREHERALAFLSEMGEPRFEAVALCNLAESLFGLDRVAEAVGSWRRAETLDRTNGNVAGEATLYLGLVLCLTGDVPGGAERLRIYLENVRDLEFGRGCVRAVGYAALPASLLGEATLAAELTASVEAFLAEEAIVLDEIERRSFAIAQARIETKAPALPIAEAMERALRFLARASSP